MPLPKSNGSKRAPLAPNEGERLLALRSYCVLDTPPEPVFDDLTSLGCALFQAPIVLISLIDEHRQFFKSVVGLASSELPRDSSFCAYAILSDEPLVVLDALADDRFQANPLVTGSPFIRFYAGAPLVGRDGLNLGSFCVIDQEPRAEFTPSQRDSLKRLAALAVDALEKRLLPARVVRMEQKLLDANERYTLATKATTDGIWDWNCVSGHIYFSARLRGIMGFPEQDHRGTIVDWLQRLHPRDAIACRENVWRLHTSLVTKFESEYRVRQEDGTWRWVQNRGIAVRAAGGKLLRLAGAMTDITSRKIKDSLTGLHSRTSLLDHLEWRIDTAAEHSRTFALLFIDLDLFKRINDSLGHSSGDLLLVELGRRLEQTLASDQLSIAARIGGDEFVILLNDIDSEDDALRYADRIQTLFQTPVQCGTQQVLISASIGIVMEGSSYGCAENMLEDADLAMYQAKARGKARSVIFSERMREQSLHRMELESELRNAVEHRALALHYQPKVLLSTGKVIGFEALIRWEHPERGPIAPDEFIPVAEQSDLIIEIGRWTLGEAIRQLAEWRSDGIISPAATIAVNLSPRQFADQGLVDHLVRQLAVHRLPAACLELEVTESVLILDATAALNVLQRLKAIGVGLELDDFGVGYSSLSYLHRFPFSSLKVDRSFVSSLGRTGGGSTITRSIIALGKALNLEVIAEGIESPEQASRLQAMGCLYGQGYLFSKPIPAREIGKLLDVQTHPRSDSTQLFSASVN